MLNALAASQGVRNGRGLALRFVGTPDEGRQAVGGTCAAAPPMRVHETAGSADTAALYEQRIWMRGEIATRMTGQDRWHDFYNALVWLRFPQLKSLLNELQVRAVSGSEDTTEYAASIAITDSGARADSAGHAAPVGHAASVQRVQPRRGWLRDRITLFDECGALLLTRDQSLVRELAAFEWESLFVRRRQSLASHLRVVVVGHALHEKLRRPYKSLCAQCVALDIAPDSDWLSIDHAARAAIDADHALHRPFMPLPLLGIPGWCSANEDPAFYNDRSVFRLGRLRR